MVCFPFGDVSIVSDKRERPLLVFCVEEDIDRDVDDDDDDCCCEAVERLTIIVVSLLYLCCCCWSSCD